MFIILEYAFVKNNVMKERERLTVKPALREKGAPRETNQDAPSVTLNTKDGART